MLVGIAIAGFVLVLLVLYVLLPMVAIRKARPAWERIRDAPTKPRAQNPDFSGGIFAYRAYKRDRTQRRFPPSRPE